ncbi:hypothetical protein [Anaerosphaera multitolerans]|uniref:Uncharacterized protein n=1 Tax=Anaerosphaera multitolerans TaxID=2487351 RepID=A0A437S6X0_9FIRM|nr:hypothetical protein [Anaerosphaera multitolerans]RVU54657.1 hypothetical protein EF514_06015 [Anaerosphaera multitolerans]
MENVSLVNDLERLNIKGINLKIASCDDVVNIIKGKKVLFTKVEIYLLSLWILLKDEEYADKLIAEKYI